MNVSIKYLNVSWRSAVRADAGDCSCDLRADMLFLPRFNPAKPAQFYMHSMNFYSFLLPCFGVSLQLRQFSLPYLAYLQIWRWGRLNPKINRSVLFKWRLFFSRRIYQHPLSSDAGIGQTRTFYESHADLGVKWFFFFKPPESALLSLLVW